MVGGCLQARKEKAEEGSEQHSVKVQHYKEANATGDKGPQFSLIIARHAASEVVGNNLVPAHEGNARGQD